MRSKEVNCSDEEALYRLTFVACGMRSTSLSARRVPKGSLPCQNTPHIGPSVTIGAWIWFDVVPNQTTIGHMR